MSFNNPHYVNEKDRKKAFDCSDGLHEVKIVGVDVTRTRNGKAMVVVALEVQNSNGERFYHRIVDGERFDSFLSTFIDAFHIPSVYMNNRQEWIGHTGLAEFCHKNDEKFGVQCTIKKFVLKNHTTNSAKVENFPENILF